MEDLLRVGVIANTHGVHGEVKVFPTTDDVNRFKKLKTIKISSKKLSKNNVGSKAFKGIYKKATFTVPKGKKNSYKKILRSKGAGSKIKVK